MNINIFIKFIINSYYNNIFSINYVIICKNMKKILVVEDDKGIRQLEKDYLIKEGFTVIEASNGKEALLQFKKHQPDLIILDLNIPLINGIDVCKQIRENYSTPIIMVTAKTKEIDELKGLEVGADDYIKKPFSPRILISRIKAVLKRPKNLTSNQIIYGDLTIDINKRYVYKKNRLINLTSLQFDILHQLVQTPGKVYTREELIDMYNINNNIFDRTIDAHIKNIRKAIEDNPKSPKYILTVRGVGYKSNEQI